MNLYIWFLAGALNFFFWRYEGLAGLYNQIPEIHDDGEILEKSSLESTGEQQSLRTIEEICEKSPLRQQLHLHHMNSIIIETVPTHAIEAYKYEQIADIKVPEHSLVLNINAKIEPKCYGYLHAYASQKWSDETCFIVVSIEKDEDIVNDDHHVIQGHTPPLLRFKSIANKDYKKYNSGAVPKGVDMKKNKPFLHFPTSTGFVYQLPRDEDRLELKLKMKSLLENLSTIEKYIRKKIKHIKKDIIVMTLNDGEMDMLVNFACSCHHHGINTSNVVVFAASKNIIDSISALGFTAIYDKEFASVSSMASAQYLDPIFVDMMWYKAFSVWILLKMGYNVLFQDVDLVWFREPFSYMNSEKRYMIRNTKIDGYFSDDGQRGLRYAPFYANSGFYYLKTNSRTEYLAWLTLSAYDSVKVTGSHQNVFIAKLIETLDIAGLSPYLLNIDDFPTGVKYHRDKPYMKGIELGWQHPYNFHMCWTLNKKDKINYFHNVNMWYINGTSYNKEGDGGGNSDEGDECALAASYKAPHGRLYKYAIQNRSGDGGESKELPLLNKCCRAPGG